MSELTDEEKFVAEILEKFTAFSERKTEDCPHCGKHVAAMHKTGRCVYLSPCGCRLWQGGIPAAWQKVRGQ